MQWIIFIVESSTFYRGVTIIFPLQLCRIKKIFTSHEHLHLLSFAVQHKSGTPFSMSPEWIYLTKTSNWAHEVTSVDSSTWKKALESEMLSFHSSPGLSNLSTFWNVPLNSIAERDIRFVFALLASPRRCFTVFNKQGFTSVFQSCEFFCLKVSSATSYDAFLLGGNFRQDKSLSFQTRFMASEEFYNFLRRDWVALSLNAVSISKVSYT